jgi:hypothetical protein
LPFPNVNEFKFALFKRIISIYFSTAGYVSQLALRQPWTPIPRETGKPTTTFEKVSPLRIFSFTCSKNNLVQEKKLLLG